MTLGDEYDDEEYESTSYLGLRNMAESVAREGDGWRYERGRAGEDEADLVGIAETRGEVPGRGGE